VDVDELDHAVIVQLSGVAYSRGLAVSQHCVKAELHIVNIDFELNYSISNFCINCYTTAVDN